MPKQLSTLDLNGNLTLTGASGTSGQVLTSGGTGVTPTWTTVSSSGVSLTPSATQTIVAQNATTTPLALRPFATSPTSDIFSVQNAAGAFSYFKVSAAGAVLATTLTTTTHTFGTQNGGTVTTQGGSAVVNAGIVRSYQATLGSPIQGAGGDALTIFGNSDTDTDWNAVTVKNISGSTIASINRYGDIVGASISKTGGTSAQFLMADGSVTTGPFVPTTGNSTITGTTTLTPSAIGNKPLIVNGLTGQTAALQEWQVNGSAVGAIFPSGAFSTYGANLFQVFTATRIPLTIKGAASQTANLQEWQNSAGTVLVSVSSAGLMFGKAADATLATAATGLGFMGLPQNATTTGSYTIVAADAGTHIYASATRTVTIPANSSVAFPIGTTLTFIAGTGATMTIAITTDTMYLAGAGTTGSRTLAAFGMATAVKITSTSWMISGNGLT
jgi:hypothetical protein